MDISVCYETDRCEMNLTILNDYLVDRKKCDSGNGFLDNGRYYPSQIQSMMKEN